MCVLRRYCSEFVRVESVYFYSILTDKFTVIVYVHCVQIRKYVSKCIIVIIIVRIITNCVLASVMVPVLMHFTCLKLCRIVCPCVFLI